MSLLVLFDIDGTLLDSAGAGRDALEEALVDVYGTAGPIDELSFAGLTDPCIARHLLTRAGMATGDIDRGLEALWMRYVELLALALEARRGRLRVNVGVEALLDELESLAAAVGLLTGNIARGAFEKLRACGLDRRFGFGAYGSDAEDRDALPAIARARAREATGRPSSRERAWIIGDTPRDIACARAGRMSVIAVATGSYTVEELQAAGADVAVPTLADTAHVISVLVDESRAAPEDARFEELEVAKQESGPGGF